MKFPGHWARRAIGQGLRDASEVNLDQLLNAMDRTAANLATLEALWARASPMIPTGPSFGSSREYDDLRRAWNGLLPGLPSIDGWTVTVELPDAGAIGQAYLDYQELGERPLPVLAASEAPGEELDEYRHRLGQARRKAVADRLQDLTITVSELISKLIDEVPRDSTHVLRDDRTQRVNVAIREIDRLLGDLVERRGRWSDLHRHMHFSQGHDWHDIAEWDWPSVKADIEAANPSEFDPISVPQIDLGQAASSRPPGGVTTKLPWDAIDDDAFERLLFDLLRALPNYQNVEWLMKTRAPDRGRDLSLERVIHDGGGTTRTERVMVQAKHWQTKSVAPTDIHGTLASLPLWEPPAIRVLVVATSGRFTADAVAIIEKHNNDAKVPYIELWPDSRLETLLAQRPEIAAGHGLVP
jgi:hypothetical protein